MTDESLGSEKGKNPGASKPEPKQVPARKQVAGKHSRSRHPSAEPIGVTKDSPPKTSDENKMPKSEGVSNTVTTADEVGTANEPAQSTEVDNDTLNDMNEKPKANLWKDLSVTLFYPAVLGYFIVLLAQNQHVVNGLWTNYKSDHIMGIIKVVLIIETLVFYCCDFLGSLYYKNYIIANFGSDLLIMTVLIFTFSALGLDEDDSAFKHLDTTLFAICCALFMGIYLLRYFAKRFIPKYHYPVELKKRYRNLAFLEGGLGAAFLVAGLWLVNKPWEKWVVAFILCVLQLISVIAYICQIVWLKKQFDKAESA